MFCVRLGFNPRQHISTNTLHNYFAPPVFVSNLKTTTICVPRLQYLDWSLRLFIQWLCQITSLPGQKEDSLTTYYERGSFPEVHCFSAVRQKKKSKFQVSHSMLSFWNLEASRLHADSLMLLGLSHRSSNSLSQRNLGLMSASMK